MLSFYSGTTAVAPAIKFNKER